MVSKQKSPVSFRSEILSHLMAALQAGECCSLLGISGVGKSNLARFISRRDVQEAYWSDANIWVVLVDSDGLVFSENSLLGSMLSSNI